MQDENERREAEGAGSTGRGEAETRPQQGGEGGTTRFGMEDGDNTDISTTGGPEADEKEDSA